MRFSPLPRGAALASAAFAMTGCASLQSADNILGVITPYRVEVVQGNVVTQEQAAQLKPGMTRAQVRDVLGSPLLTDAFHADRWDYVFTIRRQGTEPQKRSIIVQFDGDRMKNIEGADQLPTEREFVASIDTFKTSRNAPPLALTPAQLELLPLPPKVPAVEEEAVGPVRSYPALEPTP